MKTTLLPRLQTFLVAARRKSFSAAARELGVSPAAVSQSVRQLEEQLHVVLFTRTTRTVALTDAGVGHHGDARDVELGSEGVSSPPGSGGP